MKLFYLTAIATTNAGLFGNDGCDDCHPLATCRDRLILDDECVCPDGYSGNGEGADGCIDIDECDLGTDNCHVLADCTNTDGSFACECQNFYTGDGVTECVDRDECTDVSFTTGCDLTNGYCLNEDGTGFQCMCNDGYQDGTGPDAGVCIDTDECTDGTDACDANAICTNTAGSYTCACSAGFTGDGMACADIDECDVGPDVACGVNFDCTNTIGSFTCTCVDGYEAGSGPDAGICVDIDECTVDPTICGDFTVCTNQVPFYECSCITGYEMIIDNAGSHCADIDECATGADNCDVNADCANTAGSFTCACKAGYNGDGFSCTDVDECTDGTDACDANASCSNTVGSYTCTCLSGFTGDGFSCSDVDECTDATHACDANASCANTVGSYTCSCNGGFSGDGLTCTDIDECLTTPCDANAACANTVGSFTCTCNAAYYGNGFSCVYYNNVRCPGECWWYDAATDSCVADDTKIQLSCTGTGISVEADSCLFVDPDADSSAMKVTAGTCEHALVHGNNVFAWDFLTAHGCGFTYDANLATSTQISISFDIALDANANVVTSDAGTSIKIARDVGSISMECLYDSEITLSSGFNVEQSSITATNAVTSSGADLITAQLEMTFYDDNTVIDQVASPLSIGELMKVGIGFATPGNIPGSVFGMYPTECTVHGTTQSYQIMGTDGLAVLDSWAMNHLQLQYITPFDTQLYAAADAEFNFAFELFSFEGDSSLSLACDVTVCLISEGNCPTIDNFGSTFRG